MNINCSKCLKPFSISAEQLGTRGKCPHCRATVILPKSARTGMFFDAGLLDPPGSWPQNFFCATMTLFLHAALLVVVAMVPRTEFPDHLPGDGTLVMIGKLPRSVALDRSRQEFDLNENLTAETDLTTDVMDIDVMDTELMSPSIAGELATQSFQDLAFSPGSSGKSGFDFDSPHETDSLAGGTGDFSGLISRLQKNGLDIVITFDSSGSMQGEIDQVKSQISRIGSVLFGLIDKTRIGVCTYRDQGDEYVVQGLPLTDNLAEVVLYLEKVSAEGGGDEPEAVEEGLRWASIQNFRRSARKVILLFGDAPPRPDQVVNCQKLASDFRKQGGVISTVTCRNSRRMDEFVSIAELGNGESFLTSGEREIVTQLMVLVFGSQHREKVIEAFDLLDGE